MTLPRPLLRANPPSDDNVSSAVVGNNAKRDIVEIVEPGAVVLRRAGRLASMIGAEDVGVVVAALVCKHRTNAFEAMPVSTCLGAACAASPVVAIVLDEDGFRSPLPARRRVDRAAARLVRRAVDVESRAGAAGAGLAHHPELSFLPKRWTCAGSMS